MNDIDKLVFWKILQKTDYSKSLATKRRMSGRDRYIENDLDKEVRRISNLDTKLKGLGIEKNVMPSNKNDIYTIREILLGLNLSGHTDTFTEASNLIDEIYQRREIQNQQQYRNAPNKIST